MRLRRDAAGDEIGRVGGSAAGAERQVVLARAALVGMALDDEGILRILLEPLDLAVQRAHGFLRELGRIDEKNAVADIDGEVLGAALGSPRRR